MLGEDIPLSVIFEDDDLVVVDKPAGMVVHPAPGNWTGTLVNALKGRGEPLSDGPANDREGIVHRLDKETSGLLTRREDRPAHRCWARRCSDREIVRRYAALSWGHLDEDRVTVDKPDRPRSARPQAPMAIVSVRESGAHRRSCASRASTSGDLLRAHFDFIFVDDDRERRDDAQPHDGRSVLAAAASF